MESNLLEEIREVAGFDINYKVNKIPSKDQLTRLRELFDSKIVILGDIEANIQTAKTTLDEDKSNYDSLIAEKARLVEAFDILEGMIHPIRGASDDILAYIFEWVHFLHDDAPWTEPPSQVCRRWRIIATTTPSLWDTIHPPLAKSPSTISEYWILAAERAKSIPVVIEIHTNSSETPSSLNELHLCCPLTIFPNIRSLHIGLHDGILRHIITWLLKSEKTVRLLHLYHNYDSLPYYGPTLRDFHIITSAVKPVVLECPYIDVPIPISSVRDTAALPMVKELTVRLIGGASGLSEYFRLFPSITKLQFYYCVGVLAEESRPSQITLEHVKHIEVLGCRFPWGLKIRCAALESFHMDYTNGLIIQPDIYEFIRTHKGIRRVLVKFGQPNDNREATRTISQTRKLMECINDLGNKVRMELTVQIQLLSISNGHRFASLVASEGIVWTVVEYGEQKFLQCAWN